MSVIDKIATMVHVHGTPLDECRLVASYIADQSAGRTVASLYSSSHSALTNDQFLVRRIGLSPRQVRAWTALIRGTRTIQREGRTLGGKRGMVEALTIGPIDERERMRFERLAHIAATGRLPRHAQRVPSRSPGRQLPGC